MRRNFAAAAAAGLSFRAMADADLEFACALYISTRSEELAVTGWPIEVQHHFLGDQFQLQHGHYRAHYPEAEWWIIEHDGDRIGRLYLEQRCDDLRIIDIAMMPEWRGKGLGGAILADLMRHAASVGSRVSIHVERNNRARGLYERLGFVKVDEHGVYDLMMWSGGAAAS